MVLFDITEEVLLRLTVKDILRCKSVCKSWYSLISIPSFIKLHLKHVCKKEDKTNKQLGIRRIAMTRRFVIKKGFCCSIPEEWASYHSLIIQGSSNGLVCISSYGYRLSLTNPSTREFRKLHKPPIHPKDVSYSHRYGFGYDSSSDDHKLVMVINQGIERDIEEAYTLKDGEKNAFHRDEDGEEAERKKRKRTMGRRRRKRRFKGIWVMKNYNVKQSWKLLATQCEMKDRVHYMIKDSLHYRKIPSYFCYDAKKNKRIVEAGTSKVVVTKESPISSVDDKDVNV
nr:hypothetical protein [Tanacetum cinerariifolium]